MKLLIGIFGWVVFGLLLIYPWAIGWSNIFESPKWSWGQYFGILSILANLLVITAFAGPLFLYILSNIVRAMTGQDLVGWREYYKALTEGLW